MNIWTWLGAANGAAFTVLGALIIRHRVPLAAWQLRMQQTIRRDRSARCTPAIMLGVGLCWMLVGIGWMAGNLGHLW